MSFHDFLRRFRPLSSSPSLTTSVTNGRPQPPGTRRKRWEKSRRTNLEWIEVQTRAIPIDAVEARVTSARNVHSHADGLHTFLALPIDVLRTHAMPQRVVVGMSSPFLRHLQNVRDAYGKKEGKQATNYGVVYIVTTEPLYHTCAQTVSDLASQNDRMCFANLSGSRSRKSTFVCGSSIEATADTV
jgi:hypothetical protein